VAKRMADDHPVGGLTAPVLDPAFDSGTLNALRLRYAATAISAVDIALWDLKARLLGSSLAAARLVRPCYPRQFGHRCGNVGSPPVLERLLEW
jgi:Mandelate racemase / muconate lactonizing enzyme, N-terminal domain